MDHGDQFKLASCSAQTYYAEAAVSVLCYVFYDLLNADIGETGIDERLVNYDGGEATFKGKRKKSQKDQY